MDAPLNPQGGRRERHSRRRAKNGHGENGASAVARAAALGDPALYLNPELSVLEFDRRVLAQAADPSVPLLERLRFLAICCSNLDEFFEIRAAGLRQQVRLGIVRPGNDGLTPQESLARISEVAHSLVTAQYDLLNKELLPALRAEGIVLLRREEWGRKIARWVTEHYESNVLPVLTPVGLDPAHPFPRVQNKSLNFIVSLEGRDAFGRVSRLAVLRAPRALPRLILCPREVCGHPYGILLLTTLMEANVDGLFPGMTVTGCHQFRLTRNSDLWVDEEDVDDLLDALAGELPSRSYGQAVRLEVDDETPRDVCDYLLDVFGLDEQALYRVDGPVNLHRLSGVLDLVDRPDLRYPPHVPVVPRALVRTPDVFAVLREREVLLHHPYESFGPVMDLLRQAAADKNVLAIKMTLYRTGEDSPVVDELIAAARSGKEVTAVVELRARFDEAANIDLATRLQDAGANVVYGVVGYKAHAKLLLVVRREGDKLRRYVHLGTGNYHPETTRQYTDLGFLTADPDIGEDAHKLFQMLTGLGKAKRLRKLQQSPFALLDEILELIDAEADEARKGRPARIIGKMNALSEPAVIRALYRASQAGVRIDLIVRGLCCLRPGVSGVSETIRVRSIVDRFLEHSRVFYFHAGGEERVLCSSADWMERNLRRRVEIAYPVLNEQLRRRVIDECLEASLRDDARAWELGADGRYTRVRPVDGQSGVAAQSLLLSRVTSGR